MKLFFVLLQLLVLTVLNFQFQNYAYSQHTLNKMSQQLIYQKPDILYFSDTDHKNLKLLSVYTILVNQIREITPEYNCVFLKADKKIFQPAIDAFMSRKKSWEASIGVAQKDWEKLKITRHPYKQAPKPFLNRMRALGLRVFAVNLADNSLESKQTRVLFDKGFSGDRDSLKKAFDFGINVRNSVMAQNIYQILNTKDDKGKPICIKALMFLGGLHLAEDVVMPMGMGRQKYQSIASHPILKDYSQMAHEILDCDNFKSYSSTENARQCRQFRNSRLNSVTVENLFQSGNFFSVTSVVSSSQTAGNQLLTFPKINYNIMILSKNPNTKL